MPLAARALHMGGSTEFQPAIEQAYQERGVASTAYRVILEEGTFRLLERKFKRISSGDLMIKEARPSICYIVPSYSTDEASHMAHLPRLLNEVGKYCDLHVIIQRGSGQPEIPNAQSIYVQRPGNHVQRAVELIRIASHLRRQGCQKYFIRISASAALELNLLSRFWNLQVYHWVSGQAKDQKPPWGKGLWYRIHYEVRDQLLRLNIRLAHRFVTGPERMVDYFVKEYSADPSKTIMLYNDIDPTAFSPLNIPDAKPELRRTLGLPPEAVILLSVGRVSPSNGGHLLIPLAQLFRQHLGSAFTVVVGPIHMPHVVREASVKGLDNLFFVGPIPNNQILHYYQIADLCIIRSEIEGFPRKLLEAMACGLPVVAFDVGGIRDILGSKQQRFIVRHGDLEAFVARVMECVQQPDLRRELSEENLQMVQRFSTKRVAHMFIQRIVEGR